MSTSLKDTNTNCIHTKDAYKRLIRVADMATEYSIDEETSIKIAIEAKAVYKLPRTILINHRRVDEYMKHLYKVPNTDKYVQKKFVRIGEGSIMYSIGHHRFIEMARAAGAVYKLGESQGNTVLISLDIFDEYMEVVCTKGMTISHCIGCNYCWLKTPGICTIKDDYEIILKKILQHEKIVFITDIKFGFVSYQTKNLLDRILPIATMYLQFVDGQMRHVPRYDIRPQMGIVYTGNAEHTYLEKWMERTTLNFESTSLGVYPLEEGRGILSCI